MTHYLGTEDRVSAECALAAELGDDRPTPGLEPLTGVVHQADQGDRCITDERRQLDELVETSIWGGVEDVEGVKSAEPFGLVAGLRSFDHHRVPSTAEPLSCISPAESWPSRGKGPCARGTWAKGPVFIVGLVRPAGGSSLQRLGAPVSVGRPGRLRPTPPPATPPNWGVVLPYVWCLARSSSGGTTRGRALSSAGHHLDDRRRRLPGRTPQHSHGKGP